MNACRCPWLSTLLATWLLCSCASVPTDPRALADDHPNGIRVVSVDCAAAIRTLRAYRPTADDAARNGAVDPRAVRLAAWNIHKQADAGWDVELARMAAGNDILLLQEVTLSDTVQHVLRAAGLRWILASSFIIGEADIGVLTASRAVPIASCAQRTPEPLLRLPKSATITWLRVKDSAETLAIANVHAINFTLVVKDYRAQFDALAGVLAQHDGPIILGGDLNTWSEGRKAAVREVVAQLGLVEVTYPDDRRTRFLGHQVDYVFVRGLQVVVAGATDVTSSDHNPIEVVLRMPDAREVPIDSKP